MLKWRRRAFRLTLIRRASILRISVGEGKLERRSVKAFGYQFPKVWLRCSVSKYSMEC